MTTRSIKKRFALLMLIAFSLGCMHQTPPSLIQSLKQPGQGKTAIYVYRQTASWWRWGTSVILVDGYPVVNLRRGQWTRLMLNHGSHTLETVRLHDYGGRKMLQLDVSGTDLYVRSYKKYEGVEMAVALCLIPFPVPSEKYTLEQVNPEVAKKEMTNKYVSPSDYWSPHKFEMTRSKR